MKDVTPGAIALGSIATMSGYLLVVSSELREKILTVPSSSMWICVRSPSYLNSHVKRPAWPMRSSTSLSPLVGFASIGLTGMPALSLACSCRRASPCSRSAGTMRSRLGSSQKACFTVASAAARCSCSASPLGSFAPPPAAAASASLSATACARATRTVCSEAPMRILPCSARTMYCASFSCAETSICLTLSFLRVCTSLPLAIAISVSTLKTPRTESGFGFIIIICLPRLCSATMPRSPSCSSDSLMAATERPQVSATALIMIESPMPSSMPA
mmetsp:Transcript_37736/g.95842  ORF Transcript_37736/g.95842 Transcript_37736/m.95842 type:complete len:274 (-) Transcript_37736:184-1005(-)